MLALVLAGAAGARVPGCTLFDFGGPRSVVPGKKFHYDSTGFWYDGSNGWIRQQAGAGRITVDPSVTLAPGMRTIRLEVRPGDQVAGMLGERADIYYGGGADPSPPGGTGIGEGATQWWAWTTRTAASFRAGAWSMLMDFHNSGTAPSANIAVDVWGSKLVLQAYGGDVNDPAWSSHGLYRPFSRFVPAKRYDFVLGVRWSSDARTGWVALWLNGRRAVAQTHVATLWRGQTAYPKLANYRPGGAGWTNVVYDAGFRRAPTRAAVVRCLAGR